MGWSIGYDEHWKRDVGYGVPAHCDHPGCKAEIDRGLGYICGFEQIGGGEEGCGLFFCSAHGGGMLCQRCSNKEPHFAPSPDHPDWISHKLTDKSWGKWRRKNPVEVAHMRAALELAKKGQP